MVRLWHDRVQERCTSRSRTHPLVRERAQQPQTRGRFPSSETNRRCQTADLWVATSDVRRPTSLSYIYLWQPKAANYKAFARNLAVDVARHLPMDQQTPPTRPANGSEPPFKGDAVGADGVAAMVARLIDVVHMRDPDLAEHGRRAADIAARIATEMRLDTATSDHVHLAAQLHDIGKLGIAEAVLWKPGGLTPSEWSQIRTHPEKGYRLVADIVHGDVAAAVLAHHERPDSSGYPQGLDAQTLPITVRIVQVADAFDAITSVRPYQDAQPAEVAVDEIQRCAGTQFDPDVAAALANLTDIRPEDEEVIDVTASQSRWSRLPADPSAAAS